MWLMAALLDSTVNMSIMPSPIRGEMEAQNRAVPSGVADRMLPQGLGKT